MGYHSSILGSSVSASRLEYIRRDEHSALHEPLCDQFR